MVWGGTDAPLDGERNSILRRDSASVTEGGVADAGWS